MKKENLTVFHDGTPAFGGLRQYRKPVVRVKVKPCLQLDFPQKRAKQSI